jgi:hypothetical protein
MAYNLASVKAWLGITVNTWDTELADLMARALDAVQHELDWYFGTSRPAVEVMNGTGGRALWLRQPPLAGVTVHTRTGIDQPWTLVAATDYESDMDYTQPMTAMGRSLFNVGNWTRGKRNYRVQYNEGFAVMPGDIEQLLLDLVKGKWEGRGTTPGLKSERIGDYAYTRGDLEETEGWSMVVARWRRGRI